MFKKIITIILIFLLNVNCLAAVISDNDGSAFVTKAEFDALKNGFAKQIDDYNSSIDGKIDGAIASYLAGIQLSVAPNNLWEKIMYASNNKIRWAGYNIDSGTAAASLTPDDIITGTRYYRRKEAKIYTDLRSHSSKGDPEAGHPGIIYQLGDTQARASAVTEDLLIRAWFSKGGTYMSDQTAWTDDKWRHWTDLASTFQINSFNYSNKRKTGSGKLWELNRLPDDNYELKKWNTKAWLSNVVDVSAFTYKDFYTDVYKTTGFDKMNAFYCTAGGVNYTTLVKVEFDKGDKFVVSDVGSKPTSDPLGQISDWSYGSQKLSWAKTDDGVDYSFIFWGNNTTQTLNAITDQVVPDWTSAEEVTGYTTTDTYHTYLRPYYPYKGPTNEDVKVSRLYYRYYLPTIAPASFKLNQLENQYVSAPVTEHVKHGEGAPLLETSSEETTITVKDLSLKLFKPDNATLIDGEVRIMISLNKFKDGDFADPSDKLFDKTYTIPSSGVLEINTDPFIVAEKNHVVWINMYETTPSSGKLICFESVTI